MQGVTDWQPHELPAQHITHGEGLHLLFVSMGELGERLECILMVLGEVRDKRLEPLPEPISDAFAEHHGDNIRIGARAIRQD